MRPIPKRPFLGNGLYEFFALELLFFSILIFYKKLKMLRKIGLFFLIFLGFFLIFSWKNLYQNIMFAFFLDSEIPEIRYNQSLQIAKNGDFEAAQKIIPDSMNQFPERLFELRGDILFALHSDSGAILSEYEKSFQIEENSRIREKIALLSEQNLDEKKSEDFSDSDEQKTENNEIKNQISKDQEKRQEYLNPYRANTKNFQRDLQNLKNLLREDDFSEHKDW